MANRMKRQGTARTDEQFHLPDDVVLKAKADTLSGVCVRVRPSELVSLMVEADVALNGSSNDAEHDALVSLRETLSTFFEDPSRRETGDDEPYEPTRIWKDGRVVKEI